MRQVVCLAFILREWSNLVVGPLSLVRTFTFLEISSAQSPFFFEVVDFGHIKPKMEFSPAQLFFF